MCHTNEYGCGYPARHAPSSVSHHPWGCCAPGYGSRRFFTREETISQLGEYLEQVQAEAKGVEERIDDLKKGKA